MLKYIPNVEIIFKPEVRKLGKKDVLFVPWIEEIEEQKKLLKSHNVDYVFGHLEIGGCVTSSKGNRLKTNNAIQSDDFKKSQVYAGHIHIRQDYKNIHYIGTPYHKDRGDIGNKKGITILNMDNNKTQFIPNNYSPEFVRVNMCDILDKTLSELKSQWKNKYVDLVIKSNHVPSLNFDDVRKSLTGVFKEFNIVPDKSEEVMNLETIDVNVSEIRTMDEMFHDCMNRLDIDDEKQKNIMGILEKYKGLI